MAALLAATAVSFASEALAANKVAGKFGDWSVLVSGEGAGKTCFAASEAKSRKPDLAGRTASIFYVSAWPKDGVKAELSIALGYTPKAGSKVAVTTGKSVFKLFPAEGRAFVADTGQEGKLLDAMRKGSSLTVEATADRGTLTTDTYSLAGLGKALEALSEACK
ncbi:MAG: invasion associated locus B family protein [Hyphomicrobium sp.]